MPGCVQLDRPFPCVSLAFPVCEMECLLPACSSQSQWDEAYKSALLMARLTHIPTGPSLPGPGCPICMTTVQWALPALPCQDFHPSAGPPLCVILREGPPLCVILREPPPRDSTICVNLLHSPGIAPCPACTTGPRSPRAGSVWGKNRKSVCRGQEAKPAAPGPQELSEKTHRLPERKAGSLSGPDLPGCLQNGPRDQRTRGKSRTRRPILGSGQAWLPPPNPAICPAFLLTQ